MGGCGACESVLGSRHWTHGAFEGASGGFGAFGALYGAFGGFGALTLIPVLAIWERCGGSGVLAVNNSRPSLVLKTVLRNIRG